ncbi:MAG: phage virion morphogenesis protein, partial [Pseudomonadota bacterium]|nr:phage virion morphogenesis protein [Pseudomonadota bacterium]
EARVSRRFEDAADPNGRLWQPHPTRGYPWEYDKHYPKSGNRKLLDRTGDMLDSLNYQADGDSVRVGFGLPYAAYHEWGTKHMQRRGLLYADPDAHTLGDEDRESILDILSSYLSP